MEEGPKWLDLDSHWRLPSPQDYGAEYMKRVGRRRRQSRVNASRQGIYELPVVLICAQQE